VLGIAFALVTAILIWSYIKHEVSYDKHYSDSEEVFRVVTDWNGDKKYGVSTSVPLLPSMRENFPYIETGTRLWFMENHEVIVDNKVYREKIMLAADSSFFNTFNMKLLAGNKNLALKNPGFVAISRSIAGKMFGDENPIGKGIALEDNGEKKVFSVSCVYDDFPSTSHFQGNFIFSIQSFDIINIKNRRDHCLVTYLRLNRHENRIIVEQKLPKFMESFYGKDYSDYASLQYKLQPIRDIHLNTMIPYSGYETAQGFLFVPENSGNQMLIKLMPGQILKSIEKINSLWAKSVPDREMHYNFLDEELDFWYKTERKTGGLALILSIIAIFLSSLGMLVLVIQTINTKIKEIGIRKVNGAKVYEIIGLLNSTFVKWVSIAIILATPIAYFTMNKWLEKFAYKTELNWWIFAAAGITTLMIALLAVSYLKAATRNPVEALRYE
jgi:ABC-type antimicrobial peptide transport system permease subunit